MKSKRFTFTFCGDQVFQKIGIQTFDELEKTVKELNPDEKKREVILKYLDEEDEWITFNSEEEFKFMNEYTKNMDEINIFVSNVDYERRLKEFELRRRRTKEMKKRLAEQHYFPYCDKKSRNFLCKLKHLLVNCGKQPDSKLEKFCENFGQDKIDCNEFIEMSENYSKGKKCMGMMLNDILQKVCKAECGKKDKTTDTANPPTPKDENVQTNENEEKVEEKTEIKEEEVEVCEFEKLGYDNPELNQAVFKFLENDIEKCKKALGVIYAMKKE